MFVCVLCAFFLFLPNKKVNEDLSSDKPLHVIYTVSKLAYRI
jgi:hypothetical protein